MIELFNRFILILFIISTIKGMTIGGNCDLIKYWKNTNNYRKRYNEWMDRIPQ